MAGGGAATARSASVLSPSPPATSRKPGGEWIAGALFELQVKAGHWRDAEDTVKKSVRHDHLDAAEGRRRQAAIQFEKAKAAAAATGGVGGGGRQAIRQAAKAHELDPGFEPAAAFLARLYRDQGDIAKAEAVLQKCWVSSPHPELVEVFESLRPDLTAASKLSQIKRLTGYNKGHIESDIAIAGAAIGAKAWREARERLEAAGAGADPAARVCRMMADLVDGENGRASESREWLRRASLADPDEAWVCGHCGQAATDWESLCPRCGTFDAHQWVVPARLTRLGAVLDEGRAVIAADDGSGTA